MNKEEMIDDGYYMFYANTKLWDRPRVLAVMQRYADQQVRIYELAITSLTPGGSEYVNDPNACVDFVRADREQKHNFIVHLTIKTKELTAETAALREENERLKAENAELRNGLKKIKKVCGTIEFTSKEKASVSWELADEILSKHKP